MHRSIAKSPRQTGQVRLLGWFLCGVILLAGCHSARHVKQSPSGGVKATLPAHAIRFLQMAGFPYEGWTSTGMYRGQVQLYSDQDINQNGSIGFTDELVYHFYSPFAPFGKKLEPIGSAEEACRRGRALAGSPEGFKFSAVLRTWDFAPTGKSKGNVGRKFYSVEGRSPKSERTYGICVWADTGAVLMYDILPWSHTDKEATRHP